MICRVGYPGRPRKAGMARLGIGGYCFATRLSWQVDTGDYVDIAGRDARAFSWPMASDTLFVLI